MIAENKDIFKKTNISFTYNKESQLLAIKNELTILQYTVKSTVRLKRSFNVLNQTNVISTLFIKYISK